ncbi:hypothetical protein CYY_000576 [Polysphondylium violaceum]|uniref:EGF-like domain-containing protein n=1 Tax=Polysphondylium violaceum TaxID=133409 RepID=A0A8J4V2A0_9MYCE|nr:hypothetical protein CYY_000576 [Polysphondylium violaceum]
MKINYLFLVFICLAFSYATSQQCPQAEVDTLNSFYSQFTSLPNSDGWEPASANCCDRGGITCNAAGNVIKIEIVQGAISPNLIQIDFTPLTFLQNFTMESYVDFQQLSFSNGIKSISMTSDLKNVPSTGILLPSLEFLQLRRIDQTFLFDINYQLPNLKGLSINGGTTIDVVLNNNYLALKSIYIYNFQANFTKFFESICPLTQLRSIDLGGGYNPSENFTIPTCFATFPNLESFHGPTLLEPQPFPTLPDSVKEIVFSSASFTNIPEKLPSEIETFVCNYCFISLGPRLIPMGWESSKNLKDLEIEGNNFNGSIPDFLIERLNNFNGISNNLSQNTLVKLLKIKPYSYWDLRSNGIDEEIPEEYTTRVQGSFIDLQNNDFTERKLSTIMYCAALEYLFSGNDGFILNSTSYSQDQGSFSICSVMYAPIIENSFIEPFPLSGGKFIINNPRVLTRNQPALLHKSVNKQEKSKLVGAEIEFDPYLYFQQVLDGLKIKDSQGNEVDLACKILSWEGIVECLLNQTQIDSLAPSSSYDVYSYARKIELELVIGKSYFLGRPTIDLVNGTFINSEGGLITIYGTNFGNNTSSAIVDFINPKAPQEDPYECKVSFKNDTMIVCEVSSISKEDNIILNTRVTIGSQTNEKDYFYVIEQPPISSNCYGASDVECQGNGKCVNGYCLCNTGYIGLFCQQTISTSKPDVILPEPDVKEPSTTFGNEKSTVDFKVSVIELREIDFKGQLVKSTTPVWTLSSSQPEKEYVYSSGFETKTNIILQNNKKKLLGAEDHPPQATPQESKLVVTMNLFQESQVVEFANTSIQVEPGSIKYTVQINGYPFSSALNYLQVVFGIQALPSQPVIDACAPLNNSVVETDPNIADIKWLQMTRGNSYMVGKILNRALVDNKIVYSQFHHQVSGDNSVNIIANLPYFKTSATLDPNFSAMLDVTSDSKLPTSNECQEASAGKDNGWKIATGVSVGAAVAIASAIAGVMFYKKWQVKKQFHKDLNSKLQVAQN